MIRRMRSLFLAAFVVVGLTFGAAQLWAGQGSECLYGPCDEEGQCEELCLDLFPLNGGAGFCIVHTWCCMCAEK